MQFNNKLKRNNKGFTLLELLVTVVILALITAPFLSSFASASKTNVKSKRIQEANELSQHIIEQFKGSSVDKMVADYSLHGVEERIDDTDVKHSKKSIVYSGTVSGAALPAGFTSGYSADIKLTPTKSIVNEDNVIPVIEELDKVNCCVIAGNITKYDSSFSVAGNIADNRHITVSVWKDTTISPAKYKVQLNVQYRLGSVDVGTPKPMGPWSYDDVPTIYLLYVPLKTAPAGTTCLDVIDIDNNVYEDKIDAGGNPVTSIVNTYIIQQKAAEGLTYSYPSLLWDRVGIKEHSNTNRVYLDKLFDINNMSGYGTLNNTVVHTNIYGGSVTSVQNDKDGTVYDAVKAIKLDTIYNLDVTVNYDGDKVAKYNATKTVSGD